MDENVAKTVAVLRVILGAMCAGIAFFAVIVLWFAFGAPPRPGNPPHAVFSLVNAVVFVSTLGAHLLLPRLLAKSAEPTPASWQTSMIVRHAPLEGGALLGLVICFLAAPTGALAAQPALWLNALPAVFFWGVVARNWPTEAAYQDFRLAAGAPRSLP